MITDTEALMMIERLPWKTKSEKTKYFKGMYYEDEATLQYKKIERVESNKEYMNELVINKDNHPGIITLYGYQAVHVYDGDFLIKVFERFSQNLESATQSLFENNHHWDESQLLTTLQSISSACELLAKKGLSHYRITPRHLLVTDPDKTVKLPLAKKVNKQKDDIFSAPESRRFGLRLEPGISDVYSLGVTLLYMCFGRVPEEVEQGVKRWEDYLDEVEANYRVLGAILKKMVEANWEMRYSFRHINWLFSKYELSTFTQSPTSPSSLNSLSTLTSLNSRIASGSLRSSWSEILSMLQALDPILNLISVKPIRFLYCCSCAKMDEDVGQEGFLCSCGAINLKN